MITQTNTSKQDNFNKTHQSYYSTKNDSNISEIYRQEINISIWKRKLNDSIEKSSAYVVKKNPHLEFSEVLEPKNVENSLKSVIGKNKEMSHFFEDVSYLAFLFCELFDQKKYG